LKKLSLLLVFSLLLSVLLAPGALAVTGSDAESDGYIIKLTDSAAPPAQALTPVYAAQGLYWTRDRAALCALLDEGLVEYAEPDCSVRLTQLEEPSDPFYSMQWNLPAIQAGAARERDLTGAGVRLAIIDSGVSASHQELASVSLETGVDIVTGTSETGDALGHGTAVAGIIAAATDNGVGIAGISPQVTLVPIKCFGQSAITNVTYIISAIYQAVDELDCQIINLSLGVENDVQALRQAIDHAEENGVIVVSSVGNYGTESYFYPAAYETVVGVGSVSQDGSVSAFSQRNDSVLVLAPGDEIISLSQSDDQGYVLCSGTSYASPHVAAAAAIARSSDPALSPAGFRALLMESSSAGLDGYEMASGYGVLNIAAMLSLQEQRREQETAAVSPDAYEDIADHWGRAYINLAHESGLLALDDGEQFFPDRNITRAEFLYMLALLSGMELSGYTADFTDVSETDRFYPGVSWAAAMGIVQGNGDGTFTPLEEITREQMATLLYRYALWAGIPLAEPDEALMAKYTDRELISDWALASFSWAVAADVVHGDTETTLNPLGGATKAEGATLIINYITAILSPASPAEGEAAT